MKEVLSHNEPIWDKCTATSFVQDLKSGKISFESLKKYDTGQRLFEKLCPHIWKSNISRSYFEGYSILLFDSELCYRYRVGGAVELFEAIRYDR